MSGWIKFEKDLESDPRVLRLARAIAERQRNAGVTHVTRELALLLAMGALVRLWMYADRFVRADDTIDTSTDEIDEMLGLPGFCRDCPECWLRVVDAQTVELPNYQDHNGTEARRRAATRARVAAFRQRKRSEGTPATSSDARARIFKRHSGLCAYCGQPNGVARPPHVTKLDATLTLDHVVPKAHGGSDSERNLVAACRRCNNIKNDRTPDEAGMTWPLDENGSRYGDVTEALHVTPVTPLDQTRPDQTRPTYERAETPERLEPRPPSRFQAVRAAYPKFAGRQDWLNAEHGCEVRIEVDGETWDSLLAAVTRYAAYCAAGGVSGPQYVLTPGKFFTAPDKPWSNAWEIPPPAADPREQRHAREKAEREQSERTELARLYAARASFGVPDFRRPGPGESPAVYETALKLASRDVRPARLVDGIVSSLAAKVRGNAA